GAAGAVCGVGAGRAPPPVSLVPPTTIQIRPGQDDRPAVVTVQAKGQRARLGVEGGDGAATAIGHAQLANGVVTADDPVTYRELAVLDLEPLASEAAPGGQQLLAGGVEPVDFCPAGGQTHKLLARGTLCLLV